MTAFQGQTLRRSGLLIEAACMLGLLGLSRGNVDLGRGSPLDPGRLLWVGLAAGFLLWLTGTIATYARRKDG
jgi:hypothetical protein